MNTTITAPQGIAGITLNADGSVHIIAPNNSTLGQGPTDVLIDPNVTLGLIQSTIAALQELAIALTAHQA